MEKMVKPKDKLVYSTEKREPVLDDINMSESDLDSEIERLSAELKKAETLLKRTKTISAQRLEEIKSLKESAVAEKARLLDDVEKSQAVYDALQSDYNKLIEEKAEVQAAFEKSKNELAAAKESLNNTRSELVKSHKDLHITREEVILSQGIIQQLESQKKSVEYDKIHFERETKRLRVELDRMKTTPLLMGTVVKMIDNDHVVIRSSAGPQLVVSAPMDLTEKELAPGTNVALNQQTFSIAEVLPMLEEPEVSALELIESTSITYDQIGGLGDQLREIREVVELPLIKPEIFERIGIEPPKGALLYGPPGTGKTMIAKAVANATNATFIRVVGSELVQKYIGDGAKMVHELFEMAQKKSPSIIFIDEVDSIASRRTDDTTSADREIHRTLMQLLAEMDGFNRRSNVKIIAATNRLDILDPAILRPGRFDRMVYVPLPDADGRESIFKIHSEKMTISGDVDFKELAKLAENASGADIKAVVTEAGMFAVREEKTSIEKSDFVNAIHKVMESKKKEELPVPENMFY
ncbi:ATP-dependent zinc metalloprotease FtsH [Methanimicrococcus hongohii]|uniref:Proteasome-activating nucleotidase n=1 Tax=Methanimicrococcus hongohii TaxID=3028295 RepID=A0AA96V205_9EURY|nr:proteasome-activating nucleotidase [Methanimicrococcus sp. Hf6]WNY23598.1 ATP-dependent zinc metalloprotease FtsH [Methanimicrococcus sp. Hf6]